MASILIKNIGTLVTGKLESPLRQADSIFIDGGVTALISTGELHLPGLPLPPDPQD